jgi:hypothetical protein
MRTRRSPEAHDAQWARLVAALTKRFGDLAYLTRRRDQLGRRRIEATQGVDTRGTLPEVA